MTQNNSILKYLKHQPISVILIIVICVICMIPVPESQISNIRFFDKWTHLTMYAILVAVIMSEYGYRNNQQEATSRWWTVGTHHNGWHC